MGVNGTFFFFKKIQRKEPRNNAEHGIINKCHLFFLSLVQRFFNSLYKIDLGFQNTDTRVLRHYHACLQLRLFTGYHGTITV